MDNDGVTHEFIEQRERQSGNSHTSVGWLDIGNLATAMVGRYEPADRELRHRLQDEPPDAAAEAIDAWLRDLRRRSW